MVDNVALDNVPCARCCWNLNKEANDSTLDEMRRVSTDDVERLPHVSLGNSSTGAKSDSSRCSSGLEFAGHKHTFFAQIMMIP
jgi:hypothetical protein